MPCIGYANQTNCMFDTEDDLCHVHRCMYNISKTVSKHHVFFLEPKVYKLEYRYSLKYMTDYKYMSQMYDMYTYIHNKLKRFKHFFETIMIQRCFKRAISNPVYKMCRDRLYREYLYELSSNNVSS